MSEPIEFKSTRYTAQAPGWRVTVIWQTSTSWAVERVLTDAMFNSWSPIPTPTFKTESEALSCGMESAYALQAIVEGARAAWDGHEELSRPVLVDS